MPWILFLLVLGGVAYYFTTPDERARFFQHLRALVRGAREGAAGRRVACAPFYDALSERTSFALVTLAIVAVNAAVFLSMLFGAGSLDDPATLIAWGGNFGPRTTNGEWWRLVSSLFVHAGPLAWVAGLAGLFQIGLLLERLVGHIAFAVVYLVAGVFASLVSLVVSPVSVNLGASGAVFGVYGLLLASLFWSALHRTAATMPWRVLKSLVPAALVFGLYIAVAGSPGGWVELTGLITGLSSGVVLARRVSEEKTPARRIAAVMSAAMVIALAATLALRGITDARPEVDRVIAAEQRTAGAYQAAVARFTRNGLPASGLTRLIDRQIIPEIQAERARLKALTGVPRVHQPMVAATEEYLRLREESWRLRSEALQKANVAILKKADRTEWDSLEAFRRITSSGA